MERGKKKSASKEKKRREHKHKKLTGLVRRQPAGPNLMIRKKEKKRDKVLSKGLFRDLGGWVAKKKNNCKWPEHQYSGKARTMKWRGRSNRGAITKRKRTTGKKSLKGKGVGGGDVECTYERPTTLKQPPGKGREQTGAARIEKRRGKKAGEGRNRASVDV